MILTTLGEASTQRSTVHAKVRGATSLNMTSCAPGTDGITDFGNTLAETSYVSEEDCAMIFGSSNNTAMLRLHQTDGNGTAMWQYTGGAIDVDFDGDSGTANGYLTVDHTAGIFNANLPFSSKVAPDGKIVAASYIQVGDYFDVVRLNSNGTLDTTFAGDGKLSFKQDQVSGFYVFALAVQPDHKIILAGQRTGGSFLLRLTESGALDDTFAVDGFRLFSTGEMTTISGVSIAGDGSILIAGDNGTDAVVAKTRPDGLADTTFSGDGLMSFDAIGVSGFDKSNGVNVARDGSLYGCGIGDIGGNDRGFVAKISASGSLDNSFNGNGIRYFDFAGTSDENFMGCALNSAQTKIAMSGTAVFAGQAENVIVASVTTSGLMDTSFGDGGTGMKVIDVDNLKNQAAFNFFQKDDKLVVSGSTSVAGQGENAAIYRLDKTGALDTSFDSDGVQRYASFNNNNEGITAPHEAQDGGIVGVGYVDNGGGNFDYLFTRLDNTYSVPDWENDNAGADNDWTYANAGLFAACLRDVSGAGATAVWTEDSNNTCTTTDTDPWYAIPALGANGRVVSTASTTTNVNVALRFGLRTTPAQAPGNYYAPITFEVFAPDTP